MSSTVELAVSYKIGNAAINVFPYPHLYVRDVFPADFYTELLRHIPPAGTLKPVSEVRPVRGYPERFVLTLDQASIAALAEPYRAFWEKLTDWMISARFANLILQKFAPITQPRLQDQTLYWYDEALLVEDQTRYSLGPHTDAPAKLVSALFYLPKDDTLAKHGTSIYVPKDAGFTCPGVSHHPFDKFERMATMPFLPNSLFAFAKTENSFHGVEPIADPGIRRHLLLYDIRFKVPPAPVPEPASANAPQVRFRF